MRRKSRGMVLRGSRWSFKAKAVTGVWKEYSTGCSDLDDAIEKRDIFFRELKNGTLPNHRGKWTLSLAVSVWLDDRALRVARSTWLSERTITRNLLRVLRPDTKLEKLGAPDCIRYYESTRLKEAINPKTVNNEVQVLAAILRDANLWHRIANHKPLKVPKRDVGAVLTREEANSLMRYARTAGEFAVAAFVSVLAYATGMRTREIKHLQLRSIHIEQPNPHVYVRRQTTKSDRGARYVAVDKLALWALRKLIHRAAKLGAFMPDHFLLPTLLEKHTRESDPLHGSSGFDVTNPQSSWHAEWSELRRIVRIEHLRFHDLRHSYITRAAEAGVPIAVTQAQVGHMSAQMVEHYTHICQAAIHQAAQQIERESSDLVEILGMSPETQTVTRLNEFEEGGDSSGSDRRISST